MLHDEQRIENRHPRIKTGINNETKNVLRCIAGHRQCAKHRR